jgi:hypothetical protein
MVQNFRVRLSVWSLTPLNRSSSYAGEEVLHGEIFNLRTDPEGRLDKPISSCEGSKEQGWIRAMTGEGNFREWTPGG